LANNLNAAHLYRREGFSETGRRNQIDKDLDEIEFIKQ
jgi:ribosomal protein S18 acetylase RimI-like enzyme